MTVLDIITDIFAILGNLALVVYSDDVDHLNRAMSITLLVRSPLLIVNVVSDRFGSFRLPLWQGVSAWNRRLERCDARCE